MNVTKCSTHANLHTTIGVKVVVYDLDIWSDVLKPTWLSH